MKAVGGVVQFQDAEEGEPTSRNPVAKNAEYDFCEMISPPRVVATARKCGMRGGLES